MIQGYFNKENKDDLHSFLVFPNKVASKIFIFHWNNFYKFYNFVFVT